MPEVLSNQNSLREKLPSNYISLVLKDLKKRKKRVYDRSYISSIANEKEGFFNQEIMDSILRVAEAYAKGKHLQVKRIHRIKHMPIVKVKFNDRNAGK